MKTTDKQADANRRNAAHSTGPVTESGKAIASRNALKHGLLAREIFIDEGEGAESREKFDAVILDLKNQFDPQGPLEEILIEKIAVAYWRLRRAHRYEAGLIRKKSDKTAEVYYKSDLLDSDVVKIPGDEIDAKIQEGRGLCRKLENDKEQFRKMQEEGKDLQEIYDWKDNWERLYDYVADRVSIPFERSPASARESLKKAGWTDSRIWQAHISLCEHRMAVEGEMIEKLEKTKHDNMLALQVKRKISAIPDADDLERLLKYEGAIERQFYKAIDQLERLQRLRAGDNVPAPVNIDVTVNTKNAD